MVNGDINFHMNVSSDGNIQENKLIHKIVTQGSSLDKLQTPLLNESTLQDLVGDDKNVYDSQSFKK